MEAGVVQLPTKCVEQVICDLWYFVDTVYYTSVLCSMLNGMLSLVSCSFLNDPNNGVINCSLGDDGVPSYKDTCNFICNTGYELTGSYTKTCQSDGSWSGSDDVCRRGNVCLYH